MIGIIGFESLRIMQYLKRYTQILDAEKIDYEVVYWNRNGVPNTDLRYIPYNVTMNTYVPFKKKIMYFIKYMRFVYTTIRAHKYDRLIVLTAQTAVMLSPLLLSIYRKKYIFDYRDMTFEKNKIYKYIIKNLFRYSSINSVSSPGFLDVLGIHGKYIISHNCSDFSLRNLQPTKANVIRIVFWGMVRQVNFNKKICDIFGNDERFELRYHGEGYYKEIEQYCVDLKYENIKFTGAYDFKDIETFATNTDIVLNAYENDIQQKPALTVKMYDSMRHMLPMIVSKGSYMSKYLKGYNFIYRLSLDNIDTCDEIYDWFNSIEKNTVENEYRKLNQSIFKDEIAFIKTVQNFGNL